MLRTIPPPPVAPAPSTEVVSLREPERTLLLPVVHAANTEILRAFERRAKKALLIVNIDTSRDKARFFVTLVAATDDGDLWALDTTRELLDATATMLVEDAGSGNGRWHKLVVRIECEGEGAAIHRCDVTP
jgi:hypothetical protein